MNIDLFISRGGESGLILSAPPDAPISGVILDAETSQLTLEFEQTGDTLHLNIPVEAEYKERLLFSNTVQAAVIEDGMISEHVEVPLLYLNDPYGGNFGDVMHTGRRRPRGSLIGFEQFMKRCAFAQAVHRDDVGDESSSGSVLKGTDPNTLQYAPQLTRERALEAGLNAQQSIELGNRGPQAAPKGPGGMSMGQGGRRVVRRPTSPPPKDDE